MLNIAIELRFNNNQKKRVEKRHLIIKVSIIYLFINLLGALINNK